MTGQPEEKENYTKIPNDILEAIYTKKLNGSQYAIMLLLWRKIFGFHHCEEKISAGYISKGTGLNIKTVKKELSTLAAMNIIQIISNGQRSINTIKLNKQVDSWLGVKQPLVVNRPPTGEQMTPKPSGQSTPNAGGQMTPQEIKKESNKETIKEIIMSPDEAEFIKEIETVKNYPIDRVKDIEYFHVLCDRYPNTNILSVVKDWKINKLDNPINKKDNPRSQLNTWCKNAEKWGRNKKPTNKYNHAETEGYKDAGEW